MDPVFFTVTKTKPVATQPTSREQLTKAKQQAQTPTSQRLTAPRKISDQNLGSARGAHADFDDE